MQGSRVWKNFPNPTFAIKITHLAAKKIWLQRKNDKENFPLSLWVVKEPIPNTFRVIMHLCSLVFLDKFKYNSFEAR